MFTIMIGFFGLLLGGLIAGWIGVIIVVLLTGIAVLLPLEGYDEREFEDKIDLLKLESYNRQGVCRYVELHKNKAIYAFDNRDEYDIYFEAYEEKTLHGRIKVYESKGCSTPVLQVFKSTPSREMFTFAPFPKIEYVFLVPKGTVEDKSRKKVNTSNNIV